MAKELYRGELRFRHLGAAMEKAEREAKAQVRRRLHAKLFPPSSSASAGDSESDAKRKTDVAAE